MLASPRLKPATANLSLPEEREYLALLEQRARLKRQREEQERIEAETGGWEAEKAKCAADPLYWFDRYAWTYDPSLGAPSHAVDQIVPDRFPLIRHDVGDQLRGVIPKPGLGPQVLHSAASAANPTGRCAAPGRF